MAQLFRFLGEGLGIYPRATDNSTSDDSDESSHGEKRDRSVEERIEQSTLHEEGFVEHLLSSVPKRMGVTRADIKAALANNGHNIFQTALALNDSHTAPAKPPPLSRSISEKLYEDMGRIHSMHAVRRALDTSGRDNPMHARRVLEQNPLDYNRYCCIEMQQDEPEENFELECSLCYTEFDENDTDLMCLPCGLRTCRTCLQAKITDDIRSGSCPMCPGSCSKRLMPAIVASSMRDLCGLCGRHVAQLGLRQQVVTCCHAHTFCTECLAKHVKTSIRLKTSPVCPRASECHYTMAVPEVKDILEANIRTTDSPNVAGSTASLMRTYFSQIVPPHIAQHCSPFTRECFNPLCPARMEVPDVTVVSRLRGDRVLGVGSCRHCRLDWCLSCRLAAHPGISCQEAERMVGKWQEFMTVNAYMFGDSSFLRELRKRYDEDMLTAKICKRCPHCKKGPIYRIDGCNAMICGADAPDKRSNAQFGSWMRYRGCGKSFMWSNALPCRPAGFHGRPGGSVALVESLSTTPFEIFFQERLVDNDNEIAQSLITVGYLPKAPVVLFACRHCPDQETVRQLVNAKAAEVGEIVNESPLLLACEKRWSECVLALVAAKASAIFRDTDGKTPLLQACANMCGATTGHPQAIAALLGAGADPRECLPNGKSPLLLACAAPANPECIKLLVEAGAALNARGQAGQTPLSLACANNCADVVTYLLRGKADANMGAAHHTPLLVACKQVNPRCVQPLLEAKANAHVTDSRGRSPINLINRQSKGSLAGRRDTSCVKAMLHAKAHVSVDHGDWQVVVRDQGALMSALDLAGEDVSIVHNNCMDAVAALLKAKADPSGHAGEIAVLSLDLSKKRTRPLQQILAVDDSESSFSVRFSFSPTDNRARVHLSKRQLVEAGPSDPRNDRVRPAPDRPCHGDHEKLFGHVHKNTPHGKSAGRSEFAGRQKLFATKTSKIKEYKRSMSQSKNKRQSKPKRSWHALRGKRTYEREWSRR